LITVARTTADAVKLVLLADYDSVNNPSLAPFIEWATALTSRVGACAASKGSPLSDVELELIERYLGSHAYAMSDRPYESRRTQSASGKFVGRTEMSLDATSYGQQAQSLDISGCLSAIASGKGRKVASLGWLGKTEKEQLDYEERMR
jgi:hypothetical protein